MPLKNVSLARCFNPGKENGNDEDGAGALHAGVKQEAVSLVEGSRSLAAAARTLGVVEQTLFNWVKAHRSGSLTGAEGKPVSAEHMEISRLRAELARVKMERDILGKGEADQPMLQ